MHSGRGNRRTLAIQIVLLAGGLLVLATLQYRWIVRLADAERERVRQDLQLVTERLAEELSEEIRGTFDSFLAEEDVDPLFLYDQWRNRSRYPELVGNVYIADRTESGWTLRRVDGQARALVDSAWPPSLKPLRVEVYDLGPHGPHPEWPHPFIGSIPALFIVQRPADFFDERPRRVVLVELDRGAIATRVMPRLAARYFTSDSASRYDVAVVSSKNLVYRSSAAWDSKRADVAVTMRPLQRPPHAGAPPPILPASAAWTLLVRHRDGGLESLVAAARRRNLAISFGILLILAATAALLIVSLRRADRLRAQQAEFVAAMTHELNTPVAALRSAGENLKDGIVADREKVARYGETIVRESARLGAMIGEVLELSGMRARAPRPFAPLDLRAVIDEAVAQSRIAERAPVTIDVAIDPNLPPVKGDAQLLTRAVQNLVANAIRHGGAGQWVGVRAARDRDRVRITVEDRGAGIASEDAAHLFEPFYRGRDSANVRGAGLGLAIVKHIVDDHGGSIHVERRSAGAAFTIHLPASVSA